MSELCVLDATGDSKLIWDPTRPDEVQSAREMFDSMKAKGYIAYRVNDKGDKGEIMTTFDQNAGKIVMTPAMRGG